MFSNFNTQLTDFFLSTLILTPVILACYNLIIVPQKLLQKHKDLICNQLKSGDKVSTFNEFNGTVIYIFKNTVILELDNGCKTEILKQSIKEIIK